MPYDSNSELPEAVRDKLSPEKQTQFRSVINSLLNKGVSESSAFAQAWGAVKKQALEELQEKDRVEVNCEVSKVDEGLGLVFGYAMVCKIAGEDHFDLHGDHIPEDTMLKTLTSFMLDSRSAKIMHKGEVAGSIVFAYPLTTEIAKALDIEVKQTGAIIAMKPADKGVLAKYVSGDYTGFSIGGLKPVYEVVEDGEA